MKRHITTIALGAALAIGAAQAAMAESASTPSSGSGMSRSSENAAPETVKPNEFRASKVIGSTVYDRENRDIGSLKELIVNHDGKVDKAVIGVGGFLGVGEKNVAVPLNSIKMENDRLTLDRTKEQLQQAANFELDRDTASGSSSKPADNATNSSSKGVSGSSHPSGGTGTAH